VAAQGGVHLAPQVDAALLFEPALLVGLPQAGLEDLLLALEAAGSGDPGFEVATTLPGTPWTSIP
jgi:hypothetical protein